MVKDAKDCSRREQSDQSLSRNSSAVAVFHLEIDQTPTAVSLSTNHIPRGLARLGETRPVNGRYGEPRGCPRSVRCSDRHSVRGMWPNRVHLSLPGWQRTRMLLESGQFSRTAGTSCSIPIGLGKDDHPGMSLSTRTFPRRGMYGTSCNSS